MQTAFPITLRNVSPIPIGRTPGHLLRAIKREATNALIIIIIIIISHFLFFLLLGYVIIIIM